MSIVYIINNVFIRKSYRQIDSKSIDSDNIRVCQTTKEKFGGIGMMNAMMMQGGFGNN